MAFLIGDEYMRMIWFGFSAKGSNRREKEVAGPYRATAAHASVSTSFFEAYKVAVIKNIIYIKHRLNRSHRVLHRRGFQWSYLMFS